MKKRCRGNPLAEGVVRRNSAVIVTVQGRAQVPPLQLDELEPLNRLRSQSAPRPCRGATCGRPCSLSGRSEGRRIFTRGTKTPSIIEAILVAAGLLRVSRCL